MPHVPLLTPHGESPQDDRSETMRRLLDTYELEHELGCRMEELKRSIEGMGQLVGDQVRQAYPHSSCSIPPDTRQPSCLFLGCRSGWTDPRAGISRSGSLVRHRLRSSDRHLPIYPPVRIRLARYRHAAGKQTKRADTS